MSTPSPPRAMRATDWLLPAAAVLFVGAAYFRTPGLPFIWHDHARIVGDARVHGGATLESIVGPRVWARDHAAHDGFTFAPLLVLSYRLDFLRGGGGPGAFHVTNLLLHLTNTLLLFLFGRRLGLRAASAAAVALTWGLLPRLSEAVAWVSGRASLLGLLFALSTILLFPPPEASSRWRRLLSGAALLVGVFAAPFATGAIAAIVAESWRERRAGAFRELLPLAVGPALSIAVRLYSGAGLGPVSDTPIPLLALAAIGHYAWMLASPFSPASRIGVIAAPSLLAAAAGAVVLALVFRLVRRAAAGPSLIPLSFALAAFAFSLHLLGGSGGVVASDRQLYAPAAGALLTLALLIPERAVRAWTAIPLCLLAAGLAVGTAHRTRDFTSELAFFCAAGESADVRDTLPPLRLATLLRDAKHFEMAAEFAHTAVEATLAGGAKTLPFEALDVEASALVAAGRYDDARRVRDYVLEQAPGDPRRLIERGQVALAARDFDEARGYFERAAQAGGAALAKGAIERTAMAERQWAELSSNRAEAARAELLRTLGARTESLALSVASLRPGAAQTDGDTALYVAREGAADEAELAAGWARDRIPSRADEIGDVVASRRKLEAEISALSSRLASVLLRYRAPAQTPASEPR